MLLFNAAPEPAAFTLPAALPLAGGVVEIDTARAEPGRAAAFDPARPYELAGRALALIRVPLAEAAA